MFDNKYTRNILILLIGIAFVILAIIIANFVYQILSSKTADETLPEAETVDTLTIETEEITDTKKEELYETCVLISTDKNIILNNRETLSLNGYPVKVKESKRANKLIFSLIIDKQLPREDAILMGEELKDKFVEIRSYWIEKVTPVTDKESPDTVTSIEQTPTINDSGFSDPDTQRGDKIPIAPEYTEGIRYEVQIMANTDLGKITATKEFLESEGYKVKIVEFVKNGLTYYRLRLDADYGKVEAELIGSELKDNYQFINSYWLDKLEE